MKNFKNNQAGQTLLEILLAFSISILVLGAVILGITTSLNNAQYTKNQNLANSYAQEGMALVRQIRDSGWYDFHLKNGSFCLPGGATGLGANESDCRTDGKVGEKGDFVRSVNLEQDSSGYCIAGIPPTPTPTPAVMLKGTKVAVTVFWTDNKCAVGAPFCHKVELISCFSNVDEKQAP